MCFFKLARIDFEKIERNFRKENATAIEVDWFFPGASLFFDQSFWVNWKI